MPKSYKNDNKLKRSNELSTRRRIQNGEKKNLNKIMSTQLGATVKMSNHIFQEDKKKLLQKQKGENDLLLFVKEIKEKKNKIK